MHNGIESQRGRGQDRVGVTNPDGPRVTPISNLEIVPTQYNQPSNLTYPVVTMAYNADNQRVQKRS
jgi:hypothetical protein